jgi:hypothetical protein
MTERAVDSRFPWFSRRFGLCGFCLIFPLCLCLCEQTLLIGQTANSSAGDEVRRVRGVVLNKLTNKPIAHALVFSSDQRLAMMSDDEGRFEFDVKVPSRAYAMPWFSLSARRPGYLAEPPPTVPPVYDPNSENTAIQLKLTPEAIVMGRISASGVNAPAGLSVQLLSRQVQDGVGHWEVSQSKSTNSRGEYRFADLSTGDYKVMTREWMESGFEVPVSARPMIGYPPMFYPAAADLSLAAPLHVGAGETVTADLSLRPQFYYQIRIPVRHVSPGAGVNVSVGEENGLSGFALGFNAKTQMIDGFLPNGAYHLIVSSFEGPIQTTGISELSVAGGPVEGPSVSLLPNAAIAVLVREEYTTASRRGGDGSGVIMGGIIGGGGMGGRDLVYSRMRRSVPALGVELEPYNGSGPAMTLLNLPGNNGNEPLELKDVSPGRYRVRVAPYREGYAASVASGTVNLLHEPLVVGTGSSVPPIEITLRDDGATLAGTVSLPSAEIGGRAIESAPGYIYCIPMGDDAGRFTEGSAGQDGRFNLGNIPPGEYRVLAFQNAQRNLEYRNPEAMRRYETRGTVITLSPGQTAHLVLRILSDEEE